MIKAITVIPDWLQNAIDYLNNKFTRDEDVTVCILYGHQIIVTGDDEEDCTFSNYDKYNKIIYLTDYNFYANSDGTILEHFKQCNIRNLFYDYSLHQQNMMGNFNYNYELALSHTQDMLREFLNQSN